MGSAQNNQTEQKLGFAQIEKKRNNRQRVCTMTNTITAIASSNTDPILMSGPLKQMMEDIAETPTLSSKFVKIQAYVDSLKEEQNNLKDLNLPTAKQLVDQAIKTLEIVLAQVLAAIEVLPEETAKLFKNLSLAPTNTVQHASMPYKMLALQQKVQQRLHQQRVQVQQQLLLQQHQQGLLPLQQQHLIQQQQLPQQQLLQQQQALVQQRALQMQHMQQVLRQQGGLAMQLPGQLQQGQGPQSSMDESN